MPTVVVVDDDSDVRQLLSQRLKAHGFRVVAADNPDKAVKLIHQHQPDVLVLDIEMPHYTGLEFHECLRFSRRGKGIPVVFLTGKDSPVYRIQAAKQGARAFLRKPYALGELVHIACEICREAELGTPLRS